MSIKSDARRVSLMGRTCVDSRGDACDKSGGGDGGHVCWRQTGRPPVKVQNTSNMLSAACGSLPAHHFLRRPSALLAHNNETIAHRLLLRRCVRPARWRVRPNRTRYIMQIRQLDWRVLRFFYDSHFLREEGKFAIERRRPTSGLLF